MIELMHTVCLINRIQIKKIEYDSLFFLKQRKKQNNN